MTQKDFIDYLRRELVFLTRCQRPVLDIKDRDSLLIEI